MRMKMTQKQKQRKVALYSKLASRLEDQAQELEATVFWVSSWEGNEGSMLVLQSVVNALRSEQEFAHNTARSLANRMGDL